MFTKIFDVSKPLTYWSKLIMEITLYMTNLNCVFKFTFIY
jgi:hypothetical protein